MGVQIFFHRSGTLSYHTYIEIPLPYIERCPAASPRLQAQKNQKIVPRSFFSIPGPLGCQFVNVVSGKERLPPFHHLPQAQEMSVAGMASVLVACGSKTSHMRLLFLSAAIKSPALCLVATATVLGDDGWGRRRHQPSPSQVFFLCRRVADSDDSDLLMRDVAMAYLYL